MQFFFEFIAFLANILTDSLDERKVSLLKIYLILSLFIPILLILGVMIWQFERLDFELIGFVVLFSQCLSLLLTWKVHDERRKLHK